MAKKKTPTRLVCPRCGWDASEDGRLDGWFRFVEVITRESRVEGLTSTGELEVAQDDGLLVDDEAHRPRLRCGNCGHHFAVPSGISVKLV